MEALLENRFDAPIPAIVGKAFLEQVSHEISQFDAVRRGALSADMPAGFWTDVDRSWRRSLPFHEFFRFRRWPRTGTGPALSDRRGGRHKSQRGHGARAPDDRCGRRGRGGCGEVSELSHGGFSIRSRSDLHVYVAGSRSHRAAIRHVQALRARSRAVEGTRGPLSLSRCDFFQHAHERTGREGRRRGGRANSQEWIGLSSEPAPASSDGPARGFLLRFPQEWRHSRKCRRPPMPIEKPVDVD